MASTETLAARRWFIRNVATLTQLAEEHGRSLRSFRTWKQRRDFPRPILKAGGVELYERVEVSAWVTDHDSGHGRHLDAIREYRRTGSISAAARLVGVSKETVRRWCVRHGEPLPREWARQRREMLEDVNAAPEPGPQRQIAASDPTVGPLMRRRRDMENPLLGVPRRGSRRRPQHWKPPS